MGEQGENAHRENASDSAQPGGSFTKEANAANAPPNPYQPAAPVDANLRGGPVVHWPVIYTSTNSHVTGVVLPLVFEL